MAKNLDVQIDSADFLDSIRPELPTTTPETRSLRKAAVEPEATAERRKASRSDSRKKVVAKTVSVIPPIESEDDYLDLFIQGAGDGSPFGQNGICAQGVPRTYHAHYPCHRKGQADLVGVH